MPRHEKSMEGLQGEGTDECPECHSKDVIREKGEMYCNSCGFVIE